MLLVAWFGVLNCVQAEFFTSIGMCQHDYCLEVILGSRARGSVLIQGGRASSTCSDQIRGE